MGKGKRARRRSFGEFLTELRRSHAAGIHAKTRADRANTERKAIQQDRRDSA